MAETKEQTKEIATTQEDRGNVVYQVAGQDVKLSYNTVRNFLTKGGGNVSDQDLVQFISICKYNQLNPFLNEAYLVKFGNSPAQMIVSKEALMKRAEACDTYEGIQAGVIVIRDNQAVELEGCFYLTTDTLVGGWAKVFRTDRKFPIVAKVNLAEYDKKQSTWNDKPSTMVAKVAKVQALREAFPTQIGAMYTAEEQGVNIEDQTFEQRNAARSKESKKIATEEVSYEEVGTKQHVEPEQPKQQPSTVTTPFPD